MKDSQKTFVQNCKKLGRTFASYQLDVYSSGASFFIFISIIPFLVVILSLLPYTPITETDLILVIGRIIPEELVPTLRAILHELFNRSRAILPISAVIALWSAARGVMAIAKGLNRINYVEETRNYFVFRLVAMLYTILFVAGVFIMMTLGVFGRRIFYMFVNNFPEIGARFFWVYDFSDTIVIAVLFLLFFFMFLILPSKRMHPRYQFPGAIFASIVWWAFTKLFSIYIMNYNAYSMYGSLTAIVIFLVWIYAGMYFMFVGAWINYRYMLYSIQKAERIEESKTEEVGFERRRSDNGPENGGL